MHRHLKPGLVYEWASDLELLISCQGVESPTDEEWDGYLACVALSSETEGPRALVITEGGRPSREQQVRLTAATSGRLARVAIRPRWPPRSRISGVLPEQHERVQRSIDRLQKKLLRAAIFVAG